MTVSSYHSSLSASINLCGPGAVSSLRPASLQSLLVPGLDFSKARCLLATGGGFRLSGTFPDPYLQCGVDPFVGGGVFPPAG